MGCPLLRGFEYIEVCGNTIRTFRIVRYIAGVCRWGVSVMQGSTVLSVMALSRCFAYMHNSRSLTPSRGLESIILANYGVRVSQCLILNQTIKRQLYKWDFPVPVGGHGSSTSSPATFELIALVWTLRTLFWKDAMRYCRNHAHFTILLFSACNKEAGHETTDYGDSSLNVACTCTMHCSEIKIAITDWCTVLTQTATIEKRVSTVPAPVLKI